MSKGVSEIETVPAKRASDGAQMCGAIPIGLDEDDVDSGKVSEGCNRGGEKHGHVELGGIKTTECAGSLQELM